MLTGNDILILKQFLSLCLFAVSETKSNMHGFEVKVNENATELLSIILLLYN